MRFSTLSTVLLMPLLAVAQYPSSASSSTTSLTTTITSTQTMTKTITVSQVVASVYSTYGALNSTVTSAPTVGSVKVTPTAAYPTSTTLPANYMGAASSLNGMFAGGAGLVVMVAAALL